MNPDTASLQLTVVLMTATNARVATHDHARDRINHSSKIQQFSGFAVEGDIHKTAAPTSRQLTVILMTRAVPDAKATGGPNVKWQATKTKTTMTKATSGVRIN